MEQRNSEPAPIPPSKCADRALASQVAETLRLAIASILPGGADVALDAPLRSYGLNSLMAARLWLEIQRKFSVDIPIKWLGACPDLSHLIARIVEQLETNMPGDAPPIPLLPVIDANPEDRFQPFPLTAIQEAYVIGKQIDLTQDAIGCHLYREFEVANLDVERLREAWQRVLAHHDMLRAIVTADGRQRIQEQAPAWTLPVTELDEQRPDQARAHIESVRRRMSHRLYDPTQWPLFSIEVSRSRRAKSLVHFSIDALLTDGHGLGLLLKQWHQCYEQDDYHLPESEFSVRDCILALKAQQATAAYQNDLSYWVERLENMPPGPGLDWAANPELEPGLTCFSRRPMSGSLTAPMWRALREKAASLNVSPTSLVLTLFAETFARHGSQQPFSLVLTTSNRLRLPPDAEHMVAPLTATTIFIVEETLGRTLEEAAQLIHQRLWQELDHASVCGVSALRELRSRNKARGQIALPVVFTSLLDAESSSKNRGFSSDCAFALSQTSGVFLDHQMWEQDEEMHFRWDVAEALFRAGAIETLFATFVNSLHALCAQSDAQPATRSLNELQKAYYVDRACGNTAAWNGCQVYHSFHVRDLDIARLESTWLRMISAYEVLRTVVTQNGQALINSQAPCGFQIPVIDLSVVNDTEAVLAAIRDDMASRAFPLARWPMFDVRVTLAGQGRAIVHCAIDLAIADGKSIHFLFRELFRLYENPAAIAHIPAPFEEYLRLQSSLTSSPEYQSGLAYWQVKFKDMPSGPRLQPEASRLPGRRRIRFEGRIPDWHRFKARAQASNISPDSILLAAFAESLCAGLDDTAFALPVVRWDGLSMQADGFRPGEFTALSWVTHVTTNIPLLAKAALYQQEIARDVAAEAASGLGELRKLVMKKRREGAFGFPVVCTSILDLSDHALPAGVTLGQWMTYTPDVSLDCIGVEEKYDLHYFWDAVESDFPSGLLNSMFARFQRLLDSFAADESQWEAGDFPAPVKTFPESAVDSFALDEAQRQTILYTWNDTEIDFPDDRLAHQFFEDKAKQMPCATALCYRDGMMSYGELNQWANRIAWRLKNMGAGRETVIGICIARSPAMIAAVFGVLKAGAAYLPIEPSLPAERAAVIMKEARASILIAASDLPNWSAPAGITVIGATACLRGPEENRALPNPEPSASSINTAYIIFTSGSTGKPKGVKVAHRSLLNLLHWCRRTFRFDATDFGLAVTSLGFDLSVFDIFGLLGCGARLYLADEEQQKDPALLLEILLNEPITFWNSAPTTLNQLMPLLPACREHAGTANLRLVFLSGDYTPLSLPDDLRSLFRNARIISLGGATEATVWSNFFIIDKIDSQWRSIPYGVPIDNAHYHIFDSRLEPCAVGVEGDLYIGGDCLSLGYCNQPGLTAERFTPNPFAKRPGQRLYNTGDRAAYFPDGNICFLGRSDNQVKIRGFRVELGEIEHRMRQHPAIKDVVVIARQDHTGDHKLVAYAVRASHASPSVKDLRAYVAQALPDYMVPNFISFIETFPATANGKLDRTALPWPLDESAPSPATSSLTKERLFAEVREIFSGLLGLTDIDPKQDLWDQGATSFTMVQASNALCASHKERVPVSILLSEPTVEGIARHLETKLTLANNQQPPRDETIASTHKASAPVIASEVARELASEVASEKASSDAAQNPNSQNPDHVDFFSSEERERFKSKRWNLRPFAPQDRLLRLEDAHFASEHYSWRSSYGDFLESPISYKAFCRFLSLLKRASIDARPKSLYPSAGATYAVQTYLHLKSNSVEGIEAGLYYYNPEAHALQLIESHPVIDRSCHFYYNRAIFDKASFGLFLIGQMRGIEPLYREQSERFLTLEAGYMAQLLMMGQAACQIGLCPVGSIAFDKIKDQFKLDDGHHFIHGLLGGHVIHAGQAASTGARPVFSEADRATRDEAHIAIIGLAGRYAGADDADTFWQNLSAGKRMIGPFPERRLGSLRRPLKTDECMPLGGFLSDIDQFDSLLFHISPQEAKLLDPQMRLLLQTVWECLENGGYTHESLRQSAPRIGVFVGVMWNDYQQAGSDEWEQSGAAKVSALASDIANRISHYFNFHGPSLAVNTSCSSSLTALHLAAESLRNKECDAAVVGAVNLLAHPYHIQLLSDLNLVLSKDNGGAFGADSSGWYLGEGSGAVLLRPAAAAAANHDFIHGIIEGTWVGHSGHTSRFGAPDADSLTLSISQALASAGITPQDIAYVECAAAGASLADATEIEALSKIFQRDNQDRPVPIGTLKPNIGHLESAAGISQLTKVLLQMKRRQIAPTIVADSLNPMLCWENLPVRVAKQLQTWERLPDAASDNQSGPLRALINSLGATGSYAHLIVRSHSPIKTTAAQRGPQVALLSAASRHQLSLCAERLRNHIARLMADGAAPSLAAIAFTLQTGRVAMTHRLALICSDLRELAEGLNAFLRAEPYDGLLTGIAEAKRATAGLLPPTQREAAALWVAGQAIYWDKYWDAPADRVPLPTYPFARESHWLDDKPGAAHARPQSASNCKDDSKARLRMEDYLRNLYADLSGIPVSHIDAQVPLERYGLNSYLVMKLNSALARDFGSLSQTLFYEYADLAGVAEHLTAQQPEARRASEARDISAIPPSAAEPYYASAASEPYKPNRRAKSDDDFNDDIAIIGIAGRYPQSPDLDQFWKNLEQERDCITPLPESRRRKGWPLDLMWGGFLDEIDRFDPLLFNISPRDAELMDPQERLFLEVVWETLEDAGYTRERLREQHHSRGAVFAGVMYNEYPFFGVEHSFKGTPVASGSALAAIANRVSYFLDLHGPSMAVDTMCSSSLTCIHLAARSLNYDECEIAIAGAVNLCLHPNKFIQLSRMQMASSDHRCRSFGAGGQGFVAGEGVGAVLLKRLSRAIADGDRIHAVIKATAINHGGKTNGYLVPNPVAQGALILEALRHARINPATISYLETHGTGTELGDPIEINGLMRAFEGEKLKPHSCAIGSVKSNIGHLEAAAGMAGLTKVILQMKHSRLVPSLHAQDLNPNIDWDNSPFFVQRESTEWRAAEIEGEDGPARKRAGISSFGAGGANAHVIVEAYEPLPKNSVAVADRPELIVLSALNEERLKIMASRLTAYVRARLTQSADANRQPNFDKLVRELARIANGEIPSGLQANKAALTPQDICAYLMEAHAPGRSPSDFSAPALSDIAYTLQVGREALRERLALVVSDPRELCEKLEKYCSGERAGVIRGRISGTGRATEQKMPGHGAQPIEQDLISLGQHWVAGGEIDWTSLHKGERPNVISLPSYPFAKVRCWLPEPLLQADSSRENEISLNDIPLYEKTWLSADAIMHAPRPIAGKIVCLFHERSESIALKLASILRPGQLLLLREGQSRDDSATCFCDEASAVRLMQSLLDRHDDIAGWIDLCDLYREDRQPGLWIARVLMLQLLLRNRRSAELRVIQVTQGLQDLSGPRPSLAGGRMAGFVRAFGAEYKNLFATVVDTDQSFDEASAAADQILAEWRLRDSVGEICYRKGQRYRPQLREIVSSKHSGLPLPDPEKVYLITGGTRGIGALAARHLAQHGARKLVLMSVQPLPPRGRWSEPGLTDEARVAIKNIQELERNGARVMLRSGPLTLRDDLDRFLTEVRTSLGEIDGVIHCAGRASDAPGSFMHKDLASMREIFEPKIDALEVLADLCERDRLSFFILFSSVSAVAPGLAAGVIDYAAANAFMDFFASYQARIGNHYYRSINWPVWREAGMGRAHPDACAWAGLASISNDEGLRLLERAMALREKANVIAVKALASGFDTTSLLEIRRDLPAAIEAAGATGSSVGSSVSERPRDWLIKIFSESLNIPEPDLDLCALFGELGVESIMLAELLQKIEAHLGRSLEPSCLLDHPTLDQLNAYLDGEDGETSRARPLSAEANDDRSRAAMDRQIAIIGMACRFPGAPDVDTFWTNLMAGRCAIAEVPASRWDHSHWYWPEHKRGKSISKWGGFINNIEDFDPAYFEMSDEEATYLDPAIRLFLEGSATCLSDAGYTDKELWGRNVGVFVGARMGNYRRRIQNMPGAPGLGADQNFIAARVAHQYNFHGPNLVIDSACSSSLVSIQLACQSLLQGDSELALAGGVDILLDEEPYLEFSAARALSPSGRCFTFDQRADGFVPGEGCGVILLKPLARALSDGDRIHAVINAVAVNNDGRTMGLTTPNPAAQAEVVRKALTASGLRADDIGMIEAHGTATMIGDPIELRALTDVYREQTDKRGFCAIGSVKSNLGHLLSAAGMAGLLKVVLALRHCQIPPTLFCETPNPRFDFAQSPFFPNTALRNWTAGKGIRAAGVSAFGLGGTNAHLIASELEPHLRDGSARVREPLAPPIFNRRRLWLEREPGKQRVSDSEFVARKIKSNGEFVTSILDLDFV